MCDPTVISIASLAAGVAGSGIGYAQQQHAQNQQRRAYDAWQQQQRQNKLDETARQNALEQKAQGAVNQATSDLSATNTQAAQAAEQTRLAAYLKGQGPASTATPQAGATPTSVADTSLTGSTKPGAVITNTDDRYHTDLAQKLHDATQNANQQLGALATIGSYGGSFGGVDNRANEILARSGRTIDTMNNFRRGSLGAFQTAQSENPAQISYTPSGIGSLGSELMAFGSQGLGKMFAGSAAEPTLGVKTTAPTMMGPNLPITPHSGINYGFGGGTGYLY